ncbi:transcriptional regulator, LysR family [Anopheles sinensis]|uniref:Transcriptional regulator, LysR family n=1 Tax=Anopheles sinensis TaxID=74873 RepID=A0A084WPZ3_ANOSI|nr:transcriptional regulator, LysR family [Anopheles sinensis]
MPMPIVSMADGRDKSSLAFAKKTKHPPNSDKHLRSRIPSVEWDLAATSRLESLSANGAVSQPNIGQKLGTNAGHLKAHTGDFRYISQPCQPLLVGQPLALQEKLGEKKKGQDDNVGPAYSLTFYGRSSLPSANSLHKVSSGFNVTRTFSAK